MDFSNNKLADLILSDNQFPPGWREEPLFHQCLNELTACSLERLSSEPLHLRESHHRLIEENRELAAANYGTFIKTAECSRGILADFKVVQQSANNVIESIPNLNQTCENFLKKAQSISHHSKLNSIALSKHTQLLELLEIPQLMETCVRNGHYDEALELVNYTKRLERKHSHLVIIQRIVAEVREATQHLLNHLVQQLKNDLQLPACLKIIGYLRRMEVFTESDLRLKFLQCRDSWFQSFLKTIPKDDPYQHATRIVEISRVHLFDIITQYRAVFSDEDPLLLMRDEEGQGANDSALFHSWLVLKIDHLLSTLSHELERMSSESDSSSSGTVAGRYQSLLAQCMYFGLSFSRVGCDFRPHIAQIFNTAIYRHFQLGLSNAVTEFGNSLPVYSLCLTHSGSNAAAYSSSIVSGSDELAAPHTLLDYPLLALLCNHILQALNNLRLCCPLNIMPDVVSSVTACLQSAGSIIANYHITELSTFTSHEEASIKLVCTAFAQHLVPHINRCLSYLVPPPSGASNWRGIPSDLVLAPIQHLLPSAPDPDFALEDNVQDVKIDDEETKPNSPESSHIEDNPAESENSADREDSVEEPDIGGENLQLDEELSLDPEIGNRVIEENKL